MPILFKVLSLSTQSGLNNIKTYFSFISICGHFPLPKKKKKSAFPHFTTLHILPLFEIPSPFLTIIPTIFHAQLNLCQFFRILKVTAGPRELPFQQLTTFAYTSINAKLLSPYCIYTQMDLISPSWSLNFDFFLTFLHGLSCFPSKSQLCVQNKLCDNKVP